MNAVSALVGRNLRLFFRDRMAVFFSLLAAGILFVLYTLFLGQLQTSDLEESFPAATSPEVKAFVDSWMFAGIVSMTAITTGLAALGVHVEDAASGRFRDFLVSPVSATQLVLGYFLSALIVALSMTFVILAVSLLYLWAADDVTVPPGALARASGIIVLTAAAFCALSAFVTSFVATPGAFTALSTIVGTVLGFLTGAYIPVGSFPPAVQAVVTALPFAQASMLMRQEFASATLDTVVAADSGARAPLRAYYGMDADLGGWPVTASFVVAVLVSVTIVFTCLGALRMRHRVRGAGRPRRSARRGSRGSLDAEIAPHLRRARRAPQSFPRSHP